MIYNAGPVAFSVIGGKPITGDFHDIMSLNARIDGVPDVIFEFVSSLPSLQDRQHVSLDNFDITDDRIRMTERLFMCDLFLGHKPVHAVIAPVPGSKAKRLGRKIRKSWRYFHSHGSKASTHYIKRFVYYIYMPVLELLLLRHGASFAHSSAIEKDGRVILFPAWGGVGKTSIMSIYMDKGWKFLSDDSCIIGSDGSACIHPLPMHIYKYHETQSHKLVSDMLRHSGQFDRLLWRCMSAFKRPDRLVRWVRPDQVFGPHKISHKGFITDVFHLHRVNGLAGFKVQEVTPHGMARLMASTMMDEINNLSLLSEVTNSVRTDSFVPDIAELFSQISSVYEKAFESVRCRLISLPQAATAQDLCDFLDDYLHF